MHDMHNPDALMSILTSVMGSDQCAAELVSLYYGKLELAQPDSTTKKRLQWRCERLIENSSLSTKQRCDAARLYGTHCEALNFFREYIERQPWLDNFCEANIAVAMLGTMTGRLLNRDEQALNFAKIVRHKGREYQVVRRAVDQTYYVLGIS